MSDRWTAFCYMLSIAVWGLALFVWLLALGLP